MNTSLSSYFSDVRDPRIILLTPVRCFLRVTPTNINEDAISKEVVPMIEKLAWENKLEMINLHHLFGDQCQRHLFPDQLHPSSIGADWNSVAEDITLTLKNKQLELPLLENSITQGWGGNRKANTTLLTPKMP